MNTKDFMSAVCDLCIALNPEALVIECTIDEYQRIQIQVLVNKPTYPAEPSRADVRRALCDGAEKAIAIAEKTCTHIEHPVIEIGGSLNTQPEGKPHTYAHVRLALRLKEEAGN